jgi:hypothetical protein
MARPSRTAQKTARADADDDERDEDLREEEEDEEEQEDDGDVEGDEPETASVSADSDSGRRRVSARDPKAGGETEEDGDEESEEDEEEVVYVARRSELAEPRRVGAGAPANKATVQARPPPSSSAATSSVVAAASSRTASAIACADSSYADIAKTLRSLDALVAQKLAAVQRDNDALRDDVRYLTQRIDSQLARSLEEHRKQRVAPRTDAVSGTHPPTRASSGSVAVRPQSVAPRVVPRSTVGSGDGGGDGAAVSRRHESARPPQQPADGESRHPPRNKPSLVSGGGDGRAGVRTADVSAGKRPPLATSSAPANEPRSRPRTR